LIYFLYLKYKNKDMEIINLINDTWQLIDDAGTVLVQGTWDQCSWCLCEIENESYHTFLTMTGL